MLWSLTLVWSAAPLSADPKITGFSPRTGAPGTTVTLTGSGLGTVNLVQFNSADAKIVFASPNLLQVIVPTNALIGAIYVRDSLGFTYDTGAALLPDFLATPRIDSVKRILPAADTPADEVRVAPGDVVEITGANYLSFTDPDFAKAVRIDFPGLTGNLRLVPNTVGTTVLHLTVPNSGVNGPVTVITPVGTVTSVGELYFQPVVTHFTPAAGVGKDLEIVGLNLRGTSQVLVGNIPVIPSFVSNTNVIVQVPNITAAVPLTVLTPGGTFLTSGTFALAPTINAFTPQGGPAATPVVITGTGLSNATKVRFGNREAPVISASANEVKTVVPSGAITAPLTIITPVGTHTTSSNFFLPPIVASVAPNRAKPGATVTVTGTSLSGATAVKFAGTPAEYTVVSDTTLTATVPEDAATGLIYVINPGGTSSLGLPFTILERKPIINSFTPESGALGTVVNLVGLNFADTTEVEFINAPATTWIVKSDVNLSVTVPAGARSGPIVVKNPFGQAQTLRNFVVETNASLSLAFSANPVSVLPEHPLVFSLEVKNSGPLPAAGTQVTLVLPDGLDYLDSTIPSGSIAVVANGLVWNVGSVAVNQSVLGLFRVKPRSVGSFTATATASTITEDPVTSDNSREVAVFAALARVNFRGREGNNVILGWPIHASDHALQAALQLRSPVWTQVTNVPVETQDEFRVKVPMTSSEKWYRLAPR